MSDPRPEHRAMWETLVRIRELLRSTSKLKRIERAGRLDALRAEVKRITDAYDASMPDDEVRALRVGIAGRLRAVHHTIELPELPHGAVEQILVRSSERGVDGLSRPTITGIIRDIYTLLMPTRRPTIDPNSNLSSDAPPKTEVIYPCVGGPQRAEIGGEVSVEAWYALHPDDADSKSLTVTARGDRVLVEVFAEATGALSLTSPPKCTLESVPGKAPGGVTFRCHAIRNGTGRVHVTFRAGGDTFTMTHSVMVFEVGSLTERRRSAQAVESGALYATLPPPELELTARVVDRGVDVELTSAIGVLYVSGIATLGDTTAETLLRAIYDGWYLGTQRSSRARERQLGVIGANLARQMLTPELTDALASQPAGHLRLRCTDPSLPWEMLRLGGPDGIPLAQAVALVRAPIRGRWGRPHRPGEVVLVSDAGRDDSNEHEALTALGFGEVSVVHSVEAFTDRQLERTPIGVLHFACDSDVKGDGSGAHALMLDDGYLSPAAIWGYPDESPLAGALVFVNACRGGHADELTPWLIGHHAWAEAFLAAGAAAVIAPVCAVDDAEASAFAVAVYRALRAGHPVAEAVRQARCARAAAAPGRFERLAYVVYAPPGVRVSSG